MGVEGRIAGIQPFAELAQGPNTVVYKGYQPGLDRFVLLKVLRREAAFDEVLARRFEEEARLVAQIQHPNVVAVYAAGREEGQAYLAAEFVEGTDLRGLLQAGPLPPKLAAFVLGEAAQGLEAAHARGILHRDLKPSNILVAYDGHVKLTDFGMASLVEDAVTLEVRGTPGYLAPEQVRGEPPTAASDLFALGATFFEMLTAHPAFPGADTGALLDAALHHDPLPRLDRLAAVPAAMRRLCERLLARDPAARYDGAGALLADLEALRADGGGLADAAALAAYLDDPAAYRRAVRPPEAVAVREVRAEPNRPAAPPREAPRRFRMALGVGMVLLLAAAMVAGGVLLGRTSAPGEEIPQDTTISRGPAPPVERQRPALDAEDGERLAGEGPVAAVEEDEAEPVTDPPPAAADSGEAPAGIDGPLEIGLVPAAGTLVVDANPWADVYLDGEPVGRTPLRRSHPAGVHEVRLENPSFPTVRTEVEVEAGREHTLRVPLWDYVGRLRVNASPWAEVLVDGAVRDTTPVLDPPLILTPGQHRLTLRREGLGAWDTTLTVRPGSSETLLLNRWLER